MANPLQPLKGLTANDRVKWDAAWKQKFLDRGYSEQDIDKIYVNKMFAAKFGENAAKKIINNAQRIDYYNRFNNLQELETELNGPNVSIDINKQNIQNNNTYNNIVSNQQFQQEDKEIPNFSKIRMGVLGLLQERYNKELEDTYKDKDAEYIKNDTYAQQLARNHKLAQDVVRGNANNADEDFNTIRKTASDILNKPVEEITETDLNYISSKNDVFRLQWNYVKREFDDKIIEDRIREDMESSEKRKFYTKDEKEDLRKKERDKLVSDLTEGSFWSKVGKSIARAENPLADDANRLEDVGLTDEADNLRKLGAELGTTALTASVSGATGILKNTSLLKNVLSTATKGGIAGFITHQIANTINDNEYTELTNRVAEDNLKIKEEDNPFTDVTPETFPSVLDNLGADIYNKFKNTKWIQNNIDYNEIWNAVKPMLDSGELLRAKNWLNDYCEEILDEYQTAFGANWDNSVKLRSSLGVLATSTAGSLVENTLLGWETLLKPAEGLVFGTIAGINELFNINDELTFGRMMTYLPNKIHSLNNLIAGEDGRVYGKDFASIAANQGYTYGATMSFCLPGGQVASARATLNSYKWLADKISKVTRINKLTPYLDKVEAITKLKNRPDVDRVLRNLGTGAILAYNEARVDGLENYNSVVETAEKNKSDVVRQIMQDCLENPEAYIKYLPTPEQLQERLQLLNENGDFEKAVLEIVKRVEDYGKQNGWSEELINQLKDSKVQEFKDYYIAQQRLNLTAENKFNIDNTEYDREIFKEAYRAYCRSTFKQAPVIAIPDYMGVSIASKFAPTRLLRMTTRAIKGNNLSVVGGILGKAGVNASKTIFAEGFTEMYQNFNDELEKMKSAHNIENYAKSLYFGNGTDLATNQMYGLFASTAQLRKDAALNANLMDTFKSTLVSTMLMGGAKMPGKGKTLSEIKADNQTMWGKVFDMVSKISPIQTGVGNAIREVKAANDVMNSAGKGLQDFLNNPESVAQLQSLSALYNATNDIVAALKKGDLNAFIGNTNTMQIAEAILMEQAKDSNVAKARLQELLRQRDIKSRSEEERNQIYKEFMENSNMDTQVQWFTDKYDNEEERKEAVLDYLSKSADQQINIFHKVRELANKYREKEGLDEYVDIRPLVFGEMLQELIPEELNDVRKPIKDIINQHFTGDNRTNAIDTITNMLLNDKYFMADFQKKEKSFVREFISNAIKEIEDNIINQDSINERQANRSSFFRTGRVQSKNYIYSALVEYLNGKDSDFKDLMKLDDYLTQSQINAKKEFDTIYEKSLIAEGKGPSKWEKFKEECMSRATTLFKPSDEKVIRRVYNKYKDDVRSLVNFMLNSEFDKDTLANALSKIQVDTQGGSQSLIEAQKIISTVNAIHNKIDGLLAETQPENAKALKTLISKVAITVDSVEDLLNIANYPTTIIKDPVMLGLLDTLLDSISEGSTIEDIPEQDFETKSPEEPSTKDPDEHGIIPYNGDSQYEFGEELDLEKRRIENEATVTQKIAEQYESEIESLNSIYDSILNSTDNSDVKDILSKIKILQDRYKTNLRLLNQLLRDDRIQYLTNEQIDQFTKERVYLFDLLAYSLPTLKSYYEDVIDAQNRKSETIKLLTDGKDGTIDETYEISTNQTEEQKQFIDKLLLVANFIENKVGIRIKGNTLSISRKLALSIYNTVTTINTFINNNSNTLFPVKLDEKQQALFEIIKKYYPLAQNTLSENKKKLEDYINKNIDKYDSETLADKAVKKFSEMYGFRDDADEIKNSIKANIDRCKKYNIPYNFNGEYEILIDNTLGIDIAIDVNAIRKNIMKQHPFKDFVINDADINSQDGHLNYVDTILFIYKLLGKHKKLYPYYNDNGDWKLYDRALLDCKNIVRRRTKNCTTISEIQDETDRLTDWEDALKYCLNNSKSDFIKQEYLKFIDKEVRYWIDGELSAAREKAIQENYDTLYEDALSEWVKDLFNYENGAIEETPIAERFKGTIIFAQSGSGKTSVCDNKTVVDSDVLFIKVLQDITGITEITFDNMNDIYKQLPYNDKTIVVRKYYQSIIDTNKEGKTVITSSIGFLQDHLDKVSFIFAFEDAEIANNHTKERKIHAYDNIEKHQKDIDTIQAIRMSDDVNALKIQENLGSTETLADRICTVDSDSLPDFSKENPYNRRVTGPQRPLGILPKKKIPKSAVGNAAQNIFKHGRKGRHYNTIPTAIPSRMKSQNLEEYREVIDVLESNGAFDYVEKGYLKKGDKVSFIQSTYKAPDGIVKPIIYIVTKEIVHPDDVTGRFKGHQVINVLDTTGISHGKIGNLISYIKSFPQESLVEPSEDIIVGTINHKTGFIIDNNRSLNEEHKCNRLLDEKDGKFGIQDANGFHEIQILMRDSNGVKTTDKSLTNPENEIDDSETMLGDDGKKFPNNTKLAVMTVNGTKNASVVVIGKSAPVQENNDLTELADTLDYVIDYGDYGKIIKTKLQKTLKFLMTKPSKFFTNPSDFNINDYFHARYVKEGRTPILINLKITQNRNTHMVEFTWEYKDNITGKFTVCKRKDGSEMVYAYPTLTTLAKLEGEADNLNMRDMTEEELYNEFGKMIKDAVNNHYIYGMPHHINGFINNDGLLQAAIKDGLLYMPTISPSNDGKIQFTGTNYVLKTFSSSENITETKQKSKKIDVEQNKTDNVSVITDESIIPTEPETVEIKDELDLTDDTESSESSNDIKDLFDSLEELPLGIDAETFETTEPVTSERIVSETPHIEGNHELDDETSANCPLF